MRHVFASVFVVAGLLFLAGCGGGDSSDSGTADSGAADTGATASGASMAAAGGVDTGGAAAAPAAAPSSGPGMSAPPPGIIRPGGTGGSDPATSPGTLAPPPDATADTGAAAASADLAPASAGLATGDPAAAYAGDASATTRIDPVTGEPIAGTASTASADIAGTYTGGAAIPGMRADASASVRPAGAYPGGLATSDPATADAALTGTPGISGGRTQEAAPTTFDGMAKVAFQQGRERDAFNYLYAWALTSDSGAAEILPNFQWVPGMRRPTIGVRWGVGVDLTIPPTFSGSAAPIGTEQALATRASRSKGGAPQRNQGAGGLTAGTLGAGAMEGTGSGGGAAQNTPVGKFAGDLGEKILAEFQTRITDGRFGKAYQNAPAPSATGNFGGGADLAAAAGLAGAAGLTGGDPASMARTGSGYGGRSGAAAGGSAGSATLSTGLTLLGIDDEKALLQKAKESGIDVCVIFRVKVKPNQAGIVINDTEVALIEVSRPTKTVFKTTMLTNTKVQQARAANTDDGVDREVKKLFEAIDREFTVTSLPAALNEENVTKRVETLAKGSYENPLPIMAEIRFYHRNKLVTDETATAAFAQLLGGEVTAKTMLEGSEDDRKQAIERWVPKS